MLSIDIKTIDHKKQRYDTCGDYFTDKRGIHFRISKMEDARSEWLVLIHELIEKALCINEGITDSKIDTFDTNWKAHGGIEEPGCDPKAPYHREHMIAMDIEKLLCRKMGLLWDTHDNDILSLEWGEHDKR